MLVKKCIHVHAQCESDVREICGLIYIYFAYTCISVSQVADPKSRVHCNAMAWHPDIATQMVTASGDTVVQVIETGNHW